MPTYMQSICAETNDIGDPKNCEMIPKWHVNKDKQLDSGRGLPAGQKLQLRGNFPIVNTHKGGALLIEYKLKDFKPHEVFRVSLNGKTIATDNQDSTDAEPRIIEHRIEKKGMYTLDITVLSDY